MSVTELSKAIATLRNEKEVLYIEYFDLVTSMMSLEHSDPRRIYIDELCAENKAKREEVSGMIISLTNSLEEERNLFRRPENRIVRFFNRRLGPLPAGTKLIHPTKENLKKVRSYRLLAFGLVMAAITALILLSTFVPWMRISPASIITSLFTSWIGGWAIFPSTVLILLLILFVTRVRSSNLYQGKFWDTAAMMEEQWFRTGAENWTAKQRIYSCVMFGAVHVINFIYPIASLLVVGLVGVVFMAVYLRVYKQTGDTELATLASAKLHATYNRFAILYALVAILLVSGFSISSVLLS